MAVPLRIRGLSSLTRSKAKDKTSSMQEVCHRPYTSKPSEYKAPSQWNVLKPIEIHWHMLNSIEVQWTKWLYGHLLEFIGSHWNSMDSNGTYWNPVECIDIQWNLLQSSGIPYNSMQCIETQRFSGIYRDPLRYNELKKEHMEIQWNSFDHIEGHWDAMGSIEIQWPALEVTGMHWDSLESIEILCKCCQFNDTC